MEVPRFQCEQAAGRNSYIQCRFALLPVRDDLPHFQGFPVKFGGSDETVAW